MELNFTLVSNVWTVKSENWSSPHQRFVPWLKDGELLCDHHVLTDEAVAFGPPCSWLSGQHASLDLPKGFKHTLDVIVREVGVNGRNVNSVKGSSYLLQRLLLVQGVRWQAQLCGALSILHDERESVDLMRLEPLKWNKCRRIFELIFYKEQLSGEQHCVLELKNRGSRG